MQKDALGCRMKEFYENRSKTKLLRRSPVMIRLDGKCFHQFTKGMVKPFDNILVETMQETMKYLCENIQGCVLGYTQSDEITLVLVDYQKLTSDAWFDYEVQKICSISASLATMAFNKIFTEKVNQMIKTKMTDYSCEMDAMEACLKANKEGEIYYKAISKGAFFDSRCFNVPKEEVNNFVLWRQLDAEKNSVSSVAQANFSHRELQGLSTKERIIKLEEEKGIIWGNLPTTLKRGSCCIKKTYFYNEDGTVKEAFYDNELYKIQAPSETYSEEDLSSAIKGELHGETIIIRTRWVIDNEIPRFSENKEYINNLIYIGD